METFFFISFIFLMISFAVIEIVNLILMNKIYDSIEILLSAQYQYSASPSMSYSWSPSQEPEED